MEQGGFYFVWNPQGHAPTFRHATWEAAREEALRLARQAPGQEFIVLGSIGCFVVNDIQYTEMHVDELPF